MLELLAFDNLAPISITQYIPNATDLRHVCISNSALLETDLSISPIFIGHSLGRWLHAFHDWTCRADQLALRLFMRGNCAMSELKVRVEYGVKLEVLANFPEVRAPHVEATRAVIADVEREFQSANSPTTIKMGPGQDQSMIHGGFWGGK